jgi:hypothetical protein
MAAEDTRTADEQQEDFELILLAVMVIASIVLGYRNRDKLKAWVNDLLGKFK